MSYVLDLIGNGQIICVLDGTTLAKVGCPPHPQILHAHASHLKHAPSFDYSVQHVS